MKLEQVVPDEEELKKMDNIQKLLYGKANLADVFQRVGQLEEVVPKYMHMTNDVRFCFEQASKYKTIIDSMVT